VDGQSRSLERGPVPLFHPALVWERDRREFLRREMHIETRRRARDAMAAVVCSQCVNACFFRAFRRRTSSEMVSLSSFCASFFHTGVVRTAASVEGGSAQQATAPGVALVQGASRGLGLEFVSIFCFWDSSRLFFPA
jgi:hypothetical protein